MKQGGLFKTARLGSRLIHPGWSSEVRRPREPSVYICSHHNLHGPVTTLTWLDFPVRTWVLNVFFDRESCRRQYAEYTFSRRFGMKRGLANLCAAVASGAVSSTVRSSGAIPVWRGSPKIHGTFRESADALRAGDSLLIFPDIAYSAEEQGIGEIYEGFLLLGRLYARETGRDLPFIPLYCDEGTKRIREGRPVVYAAQGTPREERRRVARELIAQINEMAAE